ncbi:MAG: HlyU family transcriptional regulator [Yoonia sp.]|nr:HlyU family transcriptional regulator [Yoonia sp.]MDG1861667.1 HlyU family transcriptional regulator [Yoonia sp.]
MVKFLKNLFGGKPESETAEIYGDFRIVVSPMREGSKFRLAARIERDVDGAIQTHQVIRADTFESLEQANEVSLAKAKQVIDEQGKTLFS